MNPRKSFVAGLALLAAMLGLGPAYAQTLPGLLTPPPASVCVSPTVPTEPGDTHVFPGRWWNPNRKGIGWDFFYGDGQRSMFLTLFTYDDKGRPTWFTGDAADTEFNVVSGETIWKSRLYRITWNPTGVRGRTPVGLVSVTFPRQTTTRAAVRWQFTDPGNPWADTLAHDECVFDYFRDTLTNGNTEAENAGLNQSYSSNWFYDEHPEHQLVGWGVDLLISLDRDQHYTETATVAIYDTLNNPVWLQSSDYFGATQPPADTLSGADGGYGRLRYYQHTRPGNIKPMLANCATDSCLHVVDFASTPHVNRFRRSITGVRSGWMSIFADVPTSFMLEPNPVAVKWPPPQNAGTLQVPNPSPVSHFDADRVTVDRSVCRVPDGQTCKFIVGWTSQSQGARVYRVNLNQLGAQPVLLGSGMVGTIPDDLPVGARVQYRLDYFDGSSSQSRRTPEVRVLLTGTIADANVEPADCVNGPNCDLGAHNASTGAISGEATADGGEAGYSIAIAVPPGRNGMEPQLQLSYGSRAGNGIAGLGWALSAGGAITRCPRTHEQDGRTLAVSLSNTDALCLNGQRLLILTGMGGQPKANQFDGYGQPNAIYRTEIDNQSRVIQLGQDLAGIETCFRVLEKSGNILHYGGVTSATSCVSNNRNARVSAAGVVPTQSWMLEKAEDQLGNNQFYSYTNFGSGEALLSEIKYTGHYEQEGTRRVVLEHEPRPAGSDRSSSYLAGGLTMRTQRLKQIDTWIGSGSTAEHVMTYKLRYTEPLQGGEVGLYSGRSQLQSIEQCAHQDGRERCLAPTVVTWLDASHNSVLRALTVSGLPTPTPIPNGGSVDRRVEPIGDVDGDGVREILVRQVQGAGGWRFWLVKQTADRTTAATLDITPLLSELAFLGAGGVADFDRDGRADLLGKQNNNLTLFRWNGTRGAALGTDPATVFASVPLNVPFADQVVSTDDIDGDGYPDLLLRRAPNSCNSPYSPPPLGQFNYALCFYRNTTTRSGGAIQVSFAAGVQVGDTWVLPSSESGFSAQGDINGDGVADIFVTHRSNMGEFVQQILVSRGVNEPVLPDCAAVTGFTRFQDCPADKLNLSANGTYRRPESARYWLDINADGLTDLLFATPHGTACSDGGPPGGIEYVPPTEADRGNWCIKLSTGRGFGNVIVVDGNKDALLMQTNRGTVTGGNLSKLRYANRLPVVDIDSDGKPNLLYPVALAARHCEMVMVSYVSPNNGDLCPYDDGTGNGENVEAEPCQRNVWMCSNDPRRALGIGSPASHYGLPSLKDFPAVTSNPPPSEVDELYTPAVRKAAYPELDRSTYVMAAIRFEQTGPASFTATSVNLDNSAGGGANAARRVVMSLAGSSEADVSDDMYGDGLVDSMTQVGCYNLGVSGERCHYIGGGNYGPENVSISQGPGGALTTVPVADLKNGLRTWINENVGYAERVGGAPILPDLVDSITNGVGDKAKWEISPLSSKALRGTSDLPLYELPPNESQYTDARHFYFRSSMPVVSTFFQGNGKGDILGFRSWKYGYSEALFNNGGRGFQGFRKIVKQHATAVADQARAVRIATTYHQKFPLTGRLHQVETGVPGGGSSVFATQRESFRWRCNVADRAECDIAGGSRPPNYPFLLDKVTETFDLANAERQATGAKPIPPPLLVSTTTVRYYDSAQSGAGWDAYGNPTHEETESKDEFTDEKGYGVFVTSKVGVKATTYQPPSIANWWVDRTKKVTKTVMSVNYGSTHPLPVNAETPLQELVTDYVWNENRTIASASQQPQKTGTDATEQQVTTTYGYPSVNYGVPSSVSRAILAADANGTAQTRTESYVYDTEGYFVARTTDSLGNGVSTTTRARDGKPTWVLETSGLATAIAYDGFGRTVRVDRINRAGALYEQPTQIAWEQCSAGVCPGVGAGGRNGAALQADRYAAYRVTTVKNGSPTQVAFFDSLGREIKRAVRGFDTKFNITVSDYDDMGTLARQSVPFELTAALSFTTYGNTYTYDRLGRVLSKTSPVAEPNEQTQVLTTYAYRGNRTDMSVRPTTQSCPSGTTSSLCTKASSYTSVAGLVRTVDALSGVTRHWYDAADRLVASADAGINPRDDQPVSTAPVVAGRATLHWYNELGHRTKTFDPNATNQDTSPNVVREWKFTYNPFGEPKTSTDTRGYTSSVNVRDALGRALTQTSNSPAPYGNQTMTLVDEWSYDPQTGRLAAVKRHNGKPLALWEEKYTYDDAMRPEKIATSIDIGGEARSMETLLFYDANFGRQKGIEYPSTLRVQTIYAKNGEVQDVLDADTGERLWATQSKDAWGNATAQRFGASGIGEYVTSNSTGKSRTMSWRVEGLAAQDSIDYAYDLLGNLASQTRTTPAESTVSATETYAYDQLQRLVSATPSTGTQVRYSYDALGNLTRKTDFSVDAADAYRYGTEADSNCGPNVAAKVARPGNVFVKYYCDNNGNIVRSENAGTGSGPRALRYDANNRPILVRAGNGETTLSYTPRGDRYSTVTGPMSVGKQILTGPFGYEEESPLADRRSMTQRHELGNVIVTYSPTLAHSVAYRASDRLGSTIGLMNSQMTYAQGTGEPKALLSFDAFGKPRNRDFTPRSDGSTWTGLKSTRLGFTGHEHLEVNPGLPSNDVIHMNGRAFDYGLGRFLSVDPIVQFQAYSQALNPYAYLLNNPFAGTDPSGFTMECTNAGTDCTMTNVVSMRIEGPEGEQYLVATDNEGNHLKIEGFVVQAGGQETQAIKISQETLGKLSVKDPAAVQDFRSRGFGKPTTEIKGSNYMNHLLAGHVGGFFKWDVKAACMIGTRGMAGACLGGAAVQIASGDPDGGENLKDGIENVLGGKLKAAKLFVDATTSIVSASDQAADEAIAGKRHHPGVVAVLITRDGHIFTAYSGAHSGVDPLKLMLDEIAAAGKVEDWHGNCAETNCLRKALAEGVDPRGGIIRVININRRSEDIHKSVRAPCLTCNPLLKKYNITVYDER